MKVSCACSVTNWEATCETRVRCHVSRVVYMSYTSWYRGTRYNRPYELVLCGQFPVGLHANKILYRVCKACVSLRLNSRVVPWSFWSLKFLSIFDVFVGNIMIDVFVSPSRCENGFWTQISSNLLISKNVEVDKRLSYDSYVLCRRYYSATRFRVGIPVWTK